MGQEHDELRAEWDRAQGMGRRLQRGRIVATLVASLVCAAIVCPMFLFGRLLLKLVAFPLGITAAWPVRRALWPRGQFA